MPYELIYTSVPRGLRAGSSGFCTVAATTGIPAVLMERLELLSAYRHSPLLGTWSVRANPINYMHVKLRIGGEWYHVVSRIAAFGRDYTGRTNTLAYHIAFSRSEVAKATFGPAAVLEELERRSSNWKGHVGWLAPTGLALECEPTALECKTWEQVAGDARWAEVVAEVLAHRRQLYLVATPATPAFDLIQELLWMLPTRQRWSITFSTYYTGLPPGVDCQCRFVLDGTPEAKRARKDSAAHLAHLYDLTRPLGPAPENRYAAPARAEHTLRSQTDSEAFRRVRARPTRAGQETAPIDIEPIDIGGVSEEQQWPASEELLPVQRFQSDLGTRYRKHRPAWVGLVTAIAVSCAILVALLLSVLVVSKVLLPRLRQLAQVPPKQHRSTRQGASEPSKEPSRTQHQAKRGQNRDRGRSSQVPGHGQEEVESENGPAASVNGEGSGSQSPPEEARLPANGGMRLGASERKPAEQEAERRQRSSPGPTERGAGRVTHDSGSDGHPTEERASDGRGRLDIREPIDLIEGLQPEQIIESEPNVLHLAVDLPEPTLSEKEHLLIPIKAAAIEHLQGMALKLALPTGTDLYLELRPEDAEEPETWSLSLSDPSPPKQYMLAKLRLSKKGLEWSWASAWEALDPSRGDKKLDPARVLEALRCSMLVLQLRERDWELRVQLRRPQLSDALAVFPGDAERSELLLRLNRWMTREYRLQVEVFLWPESREWTAYKFRTSKELTDLLTNKKEQGAEHKPEEFRDSESFDLGPRGHRSHDTVIALCARPQPEVPRMSLGDGPHKTLVVARFDLRSELREGKETGDVESNGDLRLRVISRKLVVCESNRHRAKGNKQPEGHEHSWANLQDMKLAQLPPRDNLRFGCRPPQQRIPKGQTAAQGKKGKGERGQEPRGARDGGKGEKAGEDKYARERELVKRVLDARERALKALRKKGALQVGWCVYVPVTLEGEGASGQGDGAGLRVLIGKTRQPQQD